MTIVYNVYAPNMFDGQFSDQYENTDRDATASNYCDAVAQRLTENWPDAEINVTYSFSESERVWVEVEEDEPETAGSVESLIQEIAQCVFDSMAFDWIENA